MEGAGLSEQQTPLEHVVGPTRGSATGPEPDWWRWPAITVVVALWSFHQCPWQDDARKLEHANSPPEAGRSVRRSLVPVRWAFVGPRGIWIHRAL